MRVVDGLFTRVIYNAVLVLATAVIVIRGLAFRRERGAWLLLGGALVLWTAADIYFSLFVQDLDPIPIPSVADGLWLGFYPPAYLAVVLLVRSRLSGLRRGMWLDGVIGAFAVAALCAAIVVQPVLAVGLGGSVWQVATTLAYPLADLILLSVATLVLAFNGWRLDPTWRRLGAGFLVFAIADAVLLADLARHLPCGWPRGRGVAAHGDVLRGGGAPPRTPRRAPTDRHGSEFKGEFSTTVDALGARQSRIKAGRLQTNGHVEALHKTIPDECWRPSFARFLMPRLAGLRRELDEYLKLYNYRRAHTGRLTKGAVPAELVRCPQDGAEMSRHCRHNWEAVQTRPRFAADGLRGMPRRGPAATRPRPTLRLGSDRHAPAYLALRRLLPRPRSAETAACRPGRQP